MQLSKVTDTSLRMEHVEIIYYNTHMYLYITMTHIYIKTTYLN